ncbi:putative fused malic enzyme oxidoreductase; putative phosphotransacetylase [Candidatus Filomicrobium marinum]|uniref:Putative fused malic enzyme oxidoreductase putative phosphotransacetylase n=1 Tax=Candidatus Filomicrobium marinum TaxID=1608628 RepID=A0A0D6JFJ0_9HYPH|nr:NADP-dependent malic enzyme [Candidatus Filomicrobium marinum]CFX26714.1 putative fused malic enzyme oxidoreductase; putative phosphotransacetylase [Candidatus Filomicrobium marinum]CPR19481.1 putative fused malic enzyme oxidoreductase; putative phosphotransacetylase [Candidatus Filomicrobium marinum]
MDEKLAAAALDYHRRPKPGKISIQPTKDLTNQLDLSLAYSPGVAYVCLAIKDEPAEAATLTARSNLVGVITNGTAVLGLGNIGPLAGKPVMEGKGCLFKKFAGIDVFDIEVAENDADRLVEIIASMEPTFGGINLEDIKAPECFIVERKLRERMNIPVFHDDQHGTAIIVAAAVTNALKLVGKKIEDVKLAGSGAGAAALACLDLLVNLGLKRENITISDIKGVVYKGRTELMDEYKERFAQETEARTLAEILPGADIFLGLSAGGVLKPEMLTEMADKPIIMALANPEPEIRPELAKAVRPDVLICTGRSDYPNQVNNVLCFPFIFRGALDVGATGITEEMKVAAVKAIAELAQAETSDIVASAYGAEPQSFGPEYLIPTPFDPRLIERIAPAVAKAAMDSGVAARPLVDLEAYRFSLSRFVYRSGPSMKPVLDAAKREKKRLIFAEGDDERVLRAAQTVVDEDMGYPVFVGAQEEINKHIRSLGLRLAAGKDCEIIDPSSDPRQAEIESAYCELMHGHGQSEASARQTIRANPTLIAAMYLRRDYADAMLCGVRGTYDEHISCIREVIGTRQGVNTLAALNMLMLTDRQLFVCDTYVNRQPTTEQIVEMTLLAAEELKDFGLTPSVALLSHSSFGSSDTPEARVMREAVAILARRAPELEVDGEMRADAALSMALLGQVSPDSRLKHDANLLVMPNVDAANIAYNLIKMTAGNGVTVGPILLGTAKPAHVLESTATVRRVVNMAALAAVEAAKAATKKASQ